MQQPYQQLDSQNNPFIYKLYLTHYNTKHTILHFIKYKQSIYGTVKSIDMLLNLLFTSATSKQCKFQGKTLQATISLDHSASKPDKFLLSQSRPKPRLH